MKKIWRPPQKTLWAIKWRPKQLATFSVKKKRDKSNFFSFLAFRRSVSVSLMDGRDF